MHVNCRRSSSICKIERKEEGKTRRYRNSSSDKSDLSPAIYCCDSTKRRRSKQESRMISEGFQIVVAPNIWEHQITLTFRTHFLDLINLRFWWLRLYFSYLINFLCRLMIFSLSIICFIVLMLVLHVIFEYLLFVKTFLTDWAGEVFDVMLMLESNNMTFFGQMIAKLLLLPSSASTSIST